MIDLIPRDVAIDSLTELSCDDNAHWGAIIDTIRAIPAIDPAAIREAALREAADIASGHDYSLQSSTAADVRAQNISSAILALIGEKK